jgi:hypothetical protein
MTAALSVGFVLGGVHASRRASRSDNALSGMELCSIDEALDQHNFDEAKRIIGLAVDYHVSVLRVSEDLRTPDSVRYLMPWTKAEEERNITLRIQTLRYYNTIHPMLEASNRNFLAPNVE